MTDEQRELIRNAEKVVIYDFGCDFCVHQLEGILEGIKTPWICKKCAREAGLIW